LYESYNYLSNGDGGTLRACTRGGQSCASGASWCQHQTCGGCLPSCTRGGQSCASGASWCRHQTCDENLQFCGVSLLLYERLTLYNSCRKKLYNWVLLNLTPFLVGSAFYALDGSPLVLFCFVSVVLVRRVELEHGGSDKIDSKSDFLLFIC
jgi:hypothetical protein